MGSLPIAEAEQLSSKPKPPRELELSYKKNYGSGLGQGLNNLQEVNQEVRA